MPHFGLFFVVCNTADSCCLYNKALCYFLATLLSIINIMYSTRDGKLVGASSSSACYIGPPGLNSRATPFGNVSFATKPYVYCMEPAYTSPYNPNAKNCVYTVRSSPSSGDPASAAPAAPFVSDKSMYVVSDVVNPQQDQQRLLLIRNGAGEEVVVVPVPIDLSVDPQIQQSILRGWQPGRFAETNKPDAYALARDLQNHCFYENVQYPNGTILPLAVRNTPKCLAAAQAAIEQSKSLRSDRCYPRHDEQQLQQRC